MQQDATVNLLPITFSLLTSSIFQQKESRRTLATEIYLKTRLLNLKGTQHLKEVYLDLPKDLQLDYANLILKTPLAHHFGFLGNLPNENLYTAIENYIEYIKTKELQKENEDATFSKSLRLCFKDIQEKSPEFFTTIIPPKKILVDDTLIKLAYEEIQKQDFMVLSANRAARHLAKITKKMIDLAQATAPRHLWSKHAYHFLNLKEAFLYCEVKIPKDLLQDILTSYSNEYKDYIPLSVLYSLPYMSVFSTDLNLNLTKWGWMLGFQGHETQNFVYPTTRIDKTNTYISKKYKISFERISSKLKTRYKSAYDTIQLQLDSNPAPDKPKWMQNWRHKKSSALQPLVDEIEGKPKAPSPLVYFSKPKEKQFFKCPVHFKVTKRKAPDSRPKHLKQADPKEAQYYDRAEAFYHLGYFVIQKKKKNIQRADYAFDFPYQVKFLERRSLFDSSMKFSTFTSDSHALKAFDKLKENPITKFKTQLPPDNRWQPIFDEYIAALSTDSNEEDNQKEIIAVLRRDESLFKKMSPELFKLYAEENPKIRNIGESHKRILFNFMADNLFEHLAHPEKQSIQLFQKRRLEDGTFVTNEKVRTFVNQPLAHKIYDKLANRLLQVIVQHINKNHLDYSLSNYLPGIAPSLQSAERIKSMIKGREIDVCNMDVKSCFDSLNILHSNFIPALTESMTLIQKLATPKSGWITCQVLMLYLKRNFESGNFKFDEGGDTPQEQEIKSMDLGGSIKVPEKGTLPTGMVLSPMLWTVLTLPALYEIKKKQDEGKLYGFDLCGDDFLAIAPANTPTPIQEEITNPLFKLAKDLDLKFHFFKNYKEKYVPISPKFKDYFNHKERKEQSNISAWAIHFPARSIPIYHAGTVVARRSLTEKITNITDKETTLPKLNMKAARLYQEGKPHFGSYLFKSVLQEPTLVNACHKQASMVRVDEVPRSERLRQILFGSQTSLRTIKDQKAAIPTYQHHYTNKETMRLREARPHDKVIFKVRSKYSRWSIRPVPKKSLGSMVSTKFSYEEYEKLKSQGYDFKVEKMANNSRRKRQIGRVGTVDRELVIRQKGSNPVNTIMG